MVTQTGHKMKLRNPQGREDKNRLDHEKGAKLLLKWGGVTALAAAVTVVALKRTELAAVLLVVMGLGGCVAPGPIRSSTVCGEPVQYHPDDLKPCNSGASACTIKPAGESTYHIYYSTLDDRVLGHEEEHVCGMRHIEPWTTIAGIPYSVVTMGGHTHWKRGDVMGRPNSGPPVKITDERIIKYVYEQQHFKL